MKRNLLRKYSKIKTITIACDGGMGSSAVGAALIRKKVKAAGLSIKVNHASINDISRETDLIVTHKNLAVKTRKLYPAYNYFSLQSYCHQESYKLLVKYLKTVNSVKNIISKQQILLSCNACSKEEAIRLIGKRMVEIGYVKSDYIDEMLQREKHFSTYIGNGVAVPHGLHYRSESIIKSGVVIAQFPAGINFNSDKAYLLVGIAGSESTQVKILSVIAELIEDENIVRKLNQVCTKDEFISMFQGVVDRT